MKKYVTYLILLSVLLLTSCRGKQNEPAPQPPTGEPPILEPSTQQEPPAEESSTRQEPRPIRAFDAQTLEELLSVIREEDIAQVGWTVDPKVNPRPSDSEVAAILRSAAGHLTRNHEVLTANGSDTDVIWSLNIYLGDPDAGSWSGDDALYLFAGLEENVVEIFGGANLPDGRVWAENETLYQLLRTSLDTPDDGEIDQEAYEKYRPYVEQFLASLYDYSSWPDAGVTVRRELTSFRAEVRDERLGAVLYPICYVTIVDPPELAPRLLAGGASVDSRLRLHEDVTGTQGVLVTVDGEAVGFAYYSFPGEDSLDHYETKEELIEAVRSGRI